MLALMCYLSSLVSNHMTSLSNMSNPAKHAYTDDVKRVAGIEPTTARYAEIGLPRSQYLRSSLHKPKK